MKHVIDWKTGFCQKCGESLFGEEKNLECKSRTMLGHLQTCNCAACNFVDYLDRDKKLKRYEVALEKIAQAPSIYCSSIARNALENIE